MLCTPVATITCVSSSSPGCGCCLRTKIRFKTFINLLQETYYYSFKYVLLLIIIPIYQQIFLNVFFMAVNPQRPLKTGRYFLTLGTGILYNEAFSCVFVVWTGQNDNTDSLFNFMKKEDIQISYSFNVLGLET